MALGVYMMFCNCIFSVRFVMCSAITNLIFLETLTKYDSLLMNTMSSFKKNVTLHQLLQYLYVVHLELLWVFSWYFLLGIQCWGQICC